MGKDIAISKLLCVLKCLSRDMHHPALSKMRERFSDVISFQDVSKSWTVHLQMSKKNPITIIHRQLEESPNGDFYFEWILVITLRKDVTTIDKVDFRINDYGFNDSATYETKQLVKNSLKQFYQPRDDIQVTLDVETTLNTIMDRVKEMPRINVYHPDLPHSVDINMLLSHLQQQLRISFKDDSSCLSINTNSGASSPKSPPLSPSLSPDVDYPDFSSSPAITLNHSFPFTIPRSPPRMIPSPNKLSIRPIGTHSSPRDGKLSISPLMSPKQNSPRGFRSNSDYRSISDYRSFGKCANQLDEEDEDDY